MTVAGLLSTPFHGAIRVGKLPRDLRDPAYRARRLYGLCFTAVYYFTPVYWPDFDREHLYEAVRDFQKRSRRFGAIAENDSD